MADNGLGSAVERHPQRRQIIDGILAGRSSRDIASVTLPKISHSAIQRYRSKVIVPAIRNPETPSRELRKSQEFNNLPITQSESASITKPSPTAVEQVIHNRKQASIVQQRVAKMWKVTSRNIARAEDAGELAVLPPLINQAHKNIELLGRLTGELEQQAPQVAIQIVIPAIQGDTQARQPVTYDAHINDVACEIGLRQK